MIKLDKLNARAGDFQLADVSLEVGAGKYCVVLGPSGAGKTVLIETIIGLHPVTGGKVLLGGRDVTHSRPEDRRIAYVPQDLALFPHLTVRENIEFGARTRGVRNDEMKRRFDRLAQLLDIGAIIDRRDTETLSIGEQQRVAIARALIVTPDAILLDEPFSALDAHLRRQLQIKLREINRELKVTIIHISHDREEAFILGDIIAIMIDGRVMQVGDRDEIYYRPACLEAAQFLLNRNIFTGEVVSRDEERGVLRLKAPGIELDSAIYNGLLPGQKAHFGIRPEEIMVIRPDRPLSPPVSRNLLEAKICAIFEKGGSHLLWLDVPELDDPLEVDIPNCAFRDMSLREGERLRVSLKMSAIWSIPDLLCVEAVTPPAADKVRSE